MTSGRAKESEQKVKRKKAKVKIMEPLMRQIELKKSVAKQHSLFAFLFLTSDF